MKTKQLKPESYTLTIEEPLILEGGNILPQVQITYTTYGILNEERSNVVWVFHALTGNSNPQDWWPGMFGEKAAFNPYEHFIVCANTLGSCYGTTGPENGNFPHITIKDIVSVHQLLRDHLGLTHVHAGIGGSLGGQQLLEWAVQEPEFFDHIIPIATNAYHSPWGIAFNEAQRMALDNIDKGKGLEAARAIAMLSYRSYEQYDKTQMDLDQRWDDFSAASYQRYQGEKLRKRFTSETYFTLSKAMDSHNVGRNYTSVTTALRRIKSRTLVISVDSDILFPVQEQKLIADSIEEAQHVVVQSGHGHDGFLVETDDFNKAIRGFLNSTH